MKVKSTGLGKTTLTAKFTELAPVTDGESQVLTLSIEATEPVHWYITTIVTADDLAQFARLMLKPVNLRRVLALMLRGLWPVRLLSSRQQEQPEVRSPARPA